MPGGESMHVWSVGFDVTDIYQGSRADDETSPETRGDRY